MIHLIQAAVPLATSLLLLSWVASERLDRDNLLEYHDSDGTVRPVQTAEDWQRRRAEIVHGMQQVMGPYPGEERRGPLDIQIIEEVDAGAYVRRLITYQSELASTNPESSDAGIANPGAAPAATRTPAYLCIPKDVLAGQGTAPAVLCLHPTNNTIGHGVVVGEGDAVNRAYAAELAERGYVTLAPAYPLLAQYQPDIAALGYASGTMKAIWDNSRGLDLLASLPYVDDAHGFAAIGHSLGGHNAIYTAVFDPRISVVVSSCGFDSFLDYYDGDPANWQPERGWCQTRYMLRLADYAGRLESIPFDFPELLGALAPRPVFVNAPLQDDNFRAASVDRCAAAARPIYELLGGPGRLVVEHPEGGHDFPPAIREAAYQTIDAVLRPAAPTP